MKLRDLIEYVPRETLIYLFHVKINEKPVARTWILLLGAGNRPDGHKVSLFRFTHKLTSAAGHTSLVRKLTSLRCLIPDVSKIIC